MVRRLGSRIAVCIGLAVSGCAWGVSSDLQRFGVISTRENGAEIEILAHGIMSEHCYRGRRGAGAYDTAVANALRRVPGSDALVNVRLQSQTHGLLGQVCVRVTGDAGRQVH